MSDVTVLEIPTDKEREVYGVLLRARAAELSEQNRINKLAVAYNDRGWMQANVFDVHESRIATLTDLIDQLKDKV